MEIAIANLNRIRTIKGLTYNDLAHITGYSKNSIQKLLSFNNEGKSRLDILIAVCTALDIDFPSIFKRGFGDYDITRESAHYGSYTDVRTDYYLRKFINRVYTENKNFTNYHLKTISGLSESTISDLLNFKTKNPRVETLIKISKGLDIPIEEMFM